MKTPLLSVLLIAIMFAFPLAVRAEQPPPERIAEKMAVKLARGVTNAVTCIAEIPKQSILTVHEMGAPGYVIGPLKGIGMTVYRGFIGIVETAFFLVPQPGYYDPMIQPTYVWQGWEPKQEAPPQVEEEKK